jgi:hypothetical protein
LKIILFFRNFEEVDEKLKSGELILVDQPKGRSDCWLSFQYVKTNDHIPITVTGAPAQHILVRCKICGIFKNFKSFNGSKNLLEHHLSPSESNLSPSEKLPCYPEINSAE